MQWQTILSYLLLVMVIVILGTKTVQCRDQHDISVGSLNNHLMHSPAAALAGKHPPPGTSRSTSNKNEFALYNRPRSIQRFDFRCPAIDRSSECHSNQQNMNNYFYYKTLTNNFHFLKCVCSASPIRFQFHRPR